MGKLSQKDVEHIAKLSKLTLSLSEIKKFQKQLSEVVNFIGQLNEIETTDIQPTSQTTGLTNVTREDNLDHSQSLTNKEATSGTEKINNNYFIVDHVFSKDN